MSSFTHTEPMMYGHHLQQLVFKDVKGVLERFSDRYEIRVSGSGGAFCEDIEQVMLALHIQKYVGIEESRKIYIELLEAMVNQLNKNKELRPYLREYPTTYAPIQLTINFVAKETRYPPKEYVHFVFKNQADILFFNNYENNKLETIQRFPLKTCI